VQNFLPRIVGEAHVLHLDQPVHAIELHSPSRLIIFRLFVQNFARALETRDGLCDLRADGHDLKDRRHEKAQKDIEGKKRSSVIVPARILCAPSSMMMALTIPISPQRKDSSAKWP